MNLKTAARRLGVHYLTAYRWVKKNELAAAKVGSTYEISEASLAAFQARRAAERRAAELPPRPVPARTQSDVDLLLWSCERALERTGTNPRALVNLVSEGIARVVQDVCIVRLLSDDGRLLVPVAYHHHDPLTFAQLAGVLDSVEDRADDDGFLAQVLRMATIVQTDHLPQELVRKLVPSQYHQFLQDAGVYSLLHVPLVSADNEPLGVLSVVRDRPGRPFSTEDRSLVERLATFLVLGIERARRIEHGWQARHDLLTRIAGALADADDLDDDQATEVVIGFVTSSDEAAAAADPEGCLLAVSPSFADLLGWSPDDLLGEPISQFLPREALRAYAIQMRRLMAGDLDFLDVDQPLVTAAGLVDARVHVVAVHRNDERPVALLATFSQPNGTASPEA